ncbi:MAG: HD domain-containing phosphohydrolase [Bacillota bacterium]
MTGRAQAAGRWGYVKARLWSAVPLILVGFILIYVFFWKGTVIPEGTWLVRVIDVVLFLLIAPAVAWWGGRTTRQLLKRLAQEEAASEEKSRLLEQRNLQLQAVLQASRTLAPVLREEQGARLAIEQVQNYTRFTRAVLIMGPDEHDRYQVLGQNGFERSQIDRLVEASQGMQKAASPVEWCRVTRQPVVVENLARDFRTAGLKELWLASGVEAMLALPLVVQEQFRGALLLFLEKSGPIATAEISLATALAGQSALFLDNARLFTQANDQRGRLDQTVQVFESMASALASTRVGVSPFLQFVADAAARLVAPARIHLSINGPFRPNPLSVTRSAGLEGLHPDELHQALFLPITLDGEEIGRLEVHLANESRTIEGDVAGILRTFVHLIAGALGNNALFSHLRQAVDEAERAYMGTLEALSKALEMRDHEVEGHSRRVVQYTLALAREIGVPDHLMTPIIRGALLHDIGKIGIPDAILRKPGPLDEEEWATMRQHPRIGYEMLKQIDFLKQAVPIILHHHERYDGTGYPAGLAEDQIPLGARIFSVADTYDAITSDRPYRKGRSHEEAVEEIQRGAGTQFDPMVVEALLALPEEELARIRDHRNEAVRQG